MYTNFSPLSLYGDRQKLLQQQQQQQELNQQNESQEIIEETTTNHEEDDESLNEEDKQRYQMSERAAKFLERTLQREKERTKEAQELFSTIQRQTITESPLASPEHPNSSKQTSTHNSRHNTPKKLNSAKKSLLTTPLEKNNSKSPSHQPSNTTTPRSAKSLKALQDKNANTEKLESYLRDLFETKLTYLSQVRSKISEVGALHKLEEEQFIETMREVLQYNSIEKDKLKDKENNLLHKLQHLQEKLQKETEEKSKTQELFSSFKAEGTAIINRLRESLNKITDKYKREKENNQILSQKMLDLEEEKSRNITPAATSNREAILEEKVSTMKKLLSRAKREIKRLKGEDSKLSSSGENLAAPTSTLTAPLNNQHMNPTGTVNNASNDMVVDDNLYYDSIEIQKLKAKLKIERELRFKLEREMEERYKQYRALLEDEEQMIDSLKGQLESLEIENTKLKKLLQVSQNQILLSSTNNNSIVNPNGGSLEQVQSDDLYAELKQLLNPEEEKMLLQKSYSSKVALDEKVEAQQKLIKILFSRFKAEEYERLKTEEQTADMVAEEEKTISFLEKKIKDLEQMISQQKHEQLQDRQQLKKILESSGVVGLQNTNNNMEQQQKTPRRETENIPVLPIPVSIDNNNNQQQHQQEEEQDEEDSGKESSNEEEEEEVEAEQEDEEKLNEEPTVESITIPKLNLTILTNLINHDEE